MGGGGVSGGGGSVWAGGLARWVPAVGQVGGWVGRWVSGLVGGWVGWWVHRCVLDYSGLASYRFVGERGATGWVGEWVGAVHNCRRMPFMFQRKMPLKIELLRMATCHSKKDGDGGRWTSMCMGCAGVMV